MFEESSEENKKILVQVFEYLKENLAMELSMDEYCLTVNLSLRNPQRLEEPVHIAYEQVEIPPGLRNYEMKSGNYD